MSPVTPDHVNPEAPWPEIVRLQEHTEQAGKVLVERLAVYPSYCSGCSSAGRIRRWSHALLRAIDAEGFARDRRLVAGRRSMPTASAGAQEQQCRASADRPAFWRLQSSGAALEEGEIVRLFQARGADFEAVCAAADELRKHTVGDVVRYVVNRNINYTNVCSFRCQFCAFSKGKLSENLRGLPYDLDARRSRTARARGVGTRRDRSVHARRHPSRLHR